MKEEEPRKDWKALLKGKKVYWILLALGLLLLACLPGSIFGDKYSAEDTEIKDRDGIAEAGKNRGNVDEEMDEQQVRIDWEQELKAALSTVKGVGKAEVMITLASGAESIVLKDENTNSESLSEEDSSGGTRVDLKAERKEETVYSDGKTPYVIKRMSAKVAGVLVVCEGGGNSQTVLNIMNVAEALFDVPAHRIVVLEMK